MATYLLFGSYMPEPVKAVSARRTHEAIALVGRYGGEFKAVYALLGVSFRTAPAVSIEAFDKLMAG